MFKDATTNENNEGTQSPTTTIGKRPRGFAVMDRDRVREIASKGGKAAHVAGTAHEFTPEEARAAGKKGGVAPHVRRGGVRKKGTHGSASTETV